MTAQSESVAFLPDVVAASFKRNLDVLDRVLEGVPAEAHLVRCAPGGAHLNWTAGHMLSTRQYVMRVLGGPNVWSELSQLKGYSRGSQPADSEVIATTDLVRALRESQAALHEAMRSADPEAPSNFNGMSVAQFVEFMAWHETYHVGQAAMLRRIAGHGGTLG